MCVHLCIDLKIEDIEDISNFILIK